MQVDMFSIINLIVPLLVLFGLSILIATLAHIVLSSKRNRFATELSCLLGVTVYIGIELALGVFSLGMTFPILLLITPFVVHEAVRPSHIQRVPELIDVSDEGVLCFREADGYTSMAALRVTGIPMKPEEENSDSKKNQLRWLLPLWREHEQSRSTVTVEAVLDDGIIELFFIIICQDKDWQRALESVKRVTQKTTIWLTRGNYVCETVHKDSFLSLGKQIDTLDEYILLTIDALPEKSSKDLYLLVQQLLKHEVSGKISVNITPTKVTKLGRERTYVQDSQRLQVRVPPRIEDHHLRAVYKHAEEVEVCEETGAFRLSVSILTRNPLIAKNTVQSVWAGTKVCLCQGNSLQQKSSQLALRKHLSRTEYMSGARVATFLEFPTALSGLATHIPTPDFPIPPPQTQTSASIILGYIMQRGKRIAQEYSIPINALCLHTGIYGQPGSGKTNTAFLIASQVYQKGIPFLAIVPAKKEWRCLCDQIPNLRIFTLGEYITPVQYNFFHPPQGVPIHTHIENIVTCFIAAWPTEGILTEYITKIFRRVYKIAGWNPRTNKRGRPILLRDLKAAKLEVQAELSYSFKLNQDFIGALTARIDSLLDDPILSVILNTVQGISIEELLSHPTILELRGMTDSQKALFTSLIMIGVAEYLETQDTLPKQMLKHLLIIEEAHHVLKSISTSSLREGHSAQQQAIDTLVQIFREARGLGLGVAIIDQLPLSLADAAVRLPGITIIHYLKDTRERTLVGAQANLNGDQLQHIGLMKCGEAIAHQGLAGSASNVQIHHFQAFSTIWTDSRISKKMSTVYQENSHLTIPNVDRVLMWKPNQELLENLITKVDSLGLVEEHIHQHMMQIDSDIVSQVRNLVSIYLTDSDEIYYYSSLLLNHLLRPIQEPTNLVGEELVDGEI